MMNNDELKNMIVSEYHKGNVVYVGLEGALLASNLDQFITQQPADGILYDLNHLPEVALTRANQGDERWIFYFLR